MENNTEMTPMPAEEENQAQYPVIVPKHELVEVEIEPEPTPEQRMDEKANLIITAAAASAATTCALPIPFADAPILVAEQVGMMASLCGVYHIDLKKNALRSIVLAVLGVGGTTIAGKTIFSSLLKLIPGAGSIVGGTIAAATGGSLTAALGKAWQKLCKDVMSGRLQPEDLTSKEGIKLLTTTLHNQLRLEMKETEEPEDVLLQSTIPADDEIIITPYSGDAEASSFEPIAEVITAPEATSEPLTEEAAEADAEPETDAESEAAPEPESTESETETAPEPEAEAAPEPEPAEPEAEAASEPDSAESEAETAPESAEPEADAVPEPAESEPETAPEEDSSDESDTEESDEDNDSDTPSSPAADTPENAETDVFPAFQTTPSAQERHPGRHAKGAALSRSDRPLMRHAKASDDSKD